MAFSRGYRGVKGGAVQSAYTDQPGIAVAGQLAFASDINNVDAMFVGETNGLAAGRGIKIAPVVDSFSFQAPNGAAFLPEAADVKAAFAGIVVFDESMQSDENGSAGWDKGRVARIVKPGRAGGRVFVKAVAAIDHTSDTVNWVTIAPADASYALGEFAPAALGGGAAGTSVALDNARWISSAAAGEFAILELF